MPSKEHSAEEIEIIFKRLRRNGRGECQKFDLNEKLFQRFNELSNVNGIIYPTSIRLPVFSVNRERYSEPTDVLFCEFPKFLNWGVCSFRVQDIPTPLFTENKGTQYTYDFCVCHDPLEENYAHSEVRAFLEKKPIEKINSKILKMQFRIQLSEKLHYVKQPE